VDVKYIAPFMDSLVKVLNDFGISDVKRGKILMKESMNVDMDITSVIGIIGDIRGNIAYSLSADTARHIISAMMMGAPVPEINAIGRSAIGELSNMITGAASSQFSTTGIKANITPPSIVFGKDIYFVISSVQTIAINMETPFGSIEINIGLEI